MLKRETGLWRASVPEMIAELRRPGRWPRWARLLRHVRKPDEQGVGDTAHRLAGASGERYIAFRKKLGLPCRCPQRRAEWNRLYPYT